MENLSTYIKFIGAGIISAFTYLFGGLDMILTLLLWLITIDYVTGVICAIVHKKLDSEIGGKGIAKKVGMLAVVAISNLVGQHVGVDIRTFVIGFYIANESLSIVENAGRMGAPVPKKLLDLLEQLKSGENE